MEMINTRLNKKNSFLNSIKYTQDPDKQTLLKIQEILEANEINIQNVNLLTKNLSETQKNKLLELYKEQINKINMNINKHKNKILKIRKNSLK